MVLVRQSLIYINHVVNKETREALCHILGVMVKKYNHDLGTIVSHSSFYELRII